MPPRDESAVELPAASDPVAGTAASRPGDADVADLADLGVLFVHGIGAQQQGETLTGFGEPLLDWLRAWLLHDSAPGTYAAAEPFEAHLRPPLLEPGVPAHCSVWIGTDRSGPARPHHWLMAEAWWGPQVLTPPLVDFTLWLLTRGPWTLLLHLVQTRWNRSLPPPARPLPRSAGAGRRLVRLAQALPLRLLARIPARDRLILWRTLLVMGITGLWSVLALVSTAALLTAALVAVVPLGAIRRAVFSLLRMLSGVIGDSYVLLRSRVQAAAFARVITRDIEWLRPRCRKLAVVAHSQGAAVVHRALHLGEAARVDLLVTVGSGIAKLEALREFEKSGAVDKAAPLLAPPLLLATLVVWLRTRGEAEWALNFGAPTFLGLAALAMLVAAWQSVLGAVQVLRIRSSRVDLTRDRPELRWWDIAASHDPVPGGTLRRHFDLPKVRGLQLPVLNSLFRDHTSYWRAGDTFLPMLARALDRCAGSHLTLSPAAALRFKCARRVHMRDLGAWAAVSWTHFVAMLLPLLFAAPRLIDTLAALRKKIVPDGLQDRAPLSFVDTALRSAADALQWVAGVLDADFGDTTRKVNWLTAAVLVGLALMAWRRVAFEIWRAWASERNARQLMQPPRAIRLDEMEPKPAQDPTWFERWAERAPEWMGALIVHGGLGLLLVLPLAVSVPYTFAPGLFSEQHFYFALGSMLALLFAVFVLSAVMMDLSKRVGEIRRLLGSIRGMQQAGWPGWRALLQTVSIGVIVVGIAMVAVLPGKGAGMSAALREAGVQLAGIGFGAVLMLTLSNATWQRLSAARYRAGVRYLWLVAPLVAAVAAQFTLAPRPGRQFPVLDAAMMTIALGVVFAGAVHMAARAIYVPKVAPEEQAPDGHTDPGAARH